MNYLMKDNKIVQLKYRKERTMNRKDLTKWKVVLKSILIISNNLRIKYLNTISFLSIYLWKIILKLVIKIFNLIKYLLNFRAGNNIVKYFNNIS